MLLVAPDSAKYKAAKFEEWDALQRCDTSLRPSASAHCGWIEDTKGYAKPTKRTSPFSHFIVAPDSGGQSI